MRSQTMNTDQKPAGYFTNLRPEMAALLPQKAKTILDVGCGQGIFSENFSDRKNLEIWGIEIDAIEAAEAQKKLFRVINTDAIGALAEIPDKKFDAIFCNDVLEHLIDPYTFLGLVKAKLNSGGVVIASIPNVRYLNNFINFVFRREWKYEDSGILDRTHLRFFTQKSMRRMFEEAGYEIISMKGINGYTSSWKFRLLNIITLGLISDTQFLQFAIIAKAK